MVYCTCNLLNMFRALICPKHVEQIISAIKHSVPSSWFPSLRMFRYSLRESMISNGRGRFLIQGLLEWELKCETLAAGH